MTCIGCAMLYKYHAKVFVYLVLCVVLAVVANLCMSRTSSKAYNYALAFRGRYSDCEVKKKVVEIPYSWLQGEISTPDQIRIGLKPNNIAFTNSTILDDYSEREKNIMRACTKMNLELFRTEGSPRELMDVYDELKTEQSDDTIKFTLSYIEVDERNKLACGISSDECDFVGIADIGEI